MSALNSQITALHGIGADAMDNLYDVIITPPGSADESLQNQFRIRAEAFSPPKFTQKKYEVRYKTVGMNRPASRVDGNREFQITFRLDAGYQVYKALLDWRRILFEPSVGYASSQLEATADPPAGENASPSLPASQFGTISVFALGVPDPEMRPLTADGIPGITNGGITQAPTGLAWEFKQVWISELTEPEFKNAGGDTQKIVATFQFGDYTSPSTVLANPASPDGQTP